MSLLSHGARALLEDSDDCTVYGEGKGAVVLFGMRDTVVVHTEDAVLVCPRDRTEKLKRLIERLPDTGLEDLL